MTSIAPPASTRILGNALPELQPAEPSRRLLLFAMRQMGAHGLHEASAAHAMLTAFGRDFRRPLTLLRTFMFDLSRTATTPIQIAPWCCCRMTAGEAMLLGVFDRIEDDPEAAALLLGDLIGVRDGMGVAMTAALVAGSFRDLGLPLS